MNIALVTALLLIVMDVPDVGPPQGMHKAQASDFDFAGAFDGACSATSNPTRESAASREICTRWSEPQYFHGIWEVGFETSSFTFMGKMDCGKMRDRSCVDLIGSVLPRRPKYDCNREFELEFIGRRSLYRVPGHLGAPTFTVQVEKVLSARLLPAPYNWECPGVAEEE